MKNLLFPTCKWPVVSVFFFCLFFSFQSLAQNQTDYFIRKTTWEESLRVSCDKLNYDYNHREGKYYYTLKFRKNWDSFNDEVDIIQEKIRYTFQDPEVRKYLDREEEDRIWYTDRKSGDYRPLAVKMAWKIDHGFKGSTVDLANAVSTWDDFQEVRKLYHLDKDFTV